MARWIKRRLYFLSAIFHFSKRFLFAHSFRKFIPPSKRVTLSFKYQIKQTVLTAIIERLFYIYFTTRKGFILMKSAIIIISILLLCCSMSYGKSCGAADCPINHFRYLKAGILQLSYAHDYIRQDKIFVGSSESFVGAIPGDHDEVQTLNERNSIQLQYGISDGFGLSVDVPFIHREHSHIAHENGNDVWEYWNFSGLGDIRLSSQYALISPQDEFAPYIGVTAGIKFPTGLTDMRNNDGETAEVSLQPGSGSTDGSVGVNYRQTIFSAPMMSGGYASTPLIIGLSYQFNGKGTNDWRFGNTLLAHLGTSYQFARHASFLLQVNGRFQGYADVGTTGEPRENSGGSWIFVSPGLSLQLSEGFSVNSYVQLPVYINVHGIQQTAKYNISLGVTYSLNLFEAD